MMGTATPKQLHAGLPKPKSIGLLSEMAASLAHDLKTMREVMASERPAARERAARTRVSPLERVAQNGADLFTRLVLFARARDERFLGTSTTELEVRSSPRSKRTAREHVTVLVIDDNYAARLAVAEVLRECGYVVFEAANLRQAREVCAAMKVAPRLALIDFVLRDAKGDQVAAMLRKRWPALFVLYFSATYPCDDRGLQAALEAPETGLLTKPSNLDAITSAVERYLTRR